MRARLARLAIKAHKYLPIPTHAGYELNGEPANRYIVPALCAGLRRYTKEQA